VDVEDLERETRHAPMGGACLLDHRRVDVHSDGAAVRADRLRDAAGDRAGAAPDVEDGEAGTQQRGETAMIGRERAGVEDRAGALGHVRPAAGDLVRPIPLGYHGLDGGVQWPRSRNTRGDPARSG